MRHRRRRMRLVVARRVQAVCPTPAAEAADNFVVERTLSLNEQSPAMSRASCCGALLVDDSCLWMIAPFARATLLSARAVNEQRREGKGPCLADAAH